MKRKNFILQMLKGAMMASTIPLLSSFTWEKGKSVIDKIELFRYDINTPEHFSWGTWYNRQHIFMQITSGDHSGWAEVVASTNNPGLDIKDWGSFLQDFKNISINDAYQHIKSQQFGNGKEGKYDKRQMEFLEMGLMDLRGRIEDKPAIELLGMNERKPIPGLYTILNSDLKKIAKHIRLAIQQNLDGHVKFKMYGKKGLDLSIIKLGRSMLGDEAFILSDANRGYTKWKFIDELAGILNELHANGLNAMEDPAEMSNNQWIGLQNKVADLALVPDYPMRPAWKGIERVTPGMGKIFNLHPESMGSLRLLALMAEKIKGFGGKIMIGDASLVGPACTVWQQIAIGLGAEWVEAREKLKGSKDYLQCVVSKATYRNDEGKFAFTPKSGFGLDMDVQLLKEICPNNVNI